MLTRKQIIDELVSYIKEETKCNTSTLYSSNGYGLFEMGDDFNTHFKMKGRKNWLFGIWVTDNENTFNVEMFGQHEWYIDKFNPHRSPFCYGFEIHKDCQHIYMIDDNGYHNYPFDVVKFGATVSEIMTSSTGSLIKHYWNYCWRNFYFHKKPMLWLLSEWFYYEVKSPTIKFFNNQVLFCWLNMKKAFHKICFGKWIDIDIYDNDSDGYSCHPRYDYNITITDKNIDNRWMNRLYGFVMPLDGFNNVSYNIKMDGKNRGFYIDSDAQSDFIHIKRKLVVLNYNKTSKEKIIDRFKYICACPYYWFKYKFEKIE